MSFKSLYKFLLIRKSPANALMLGAIIILAFIAFFVIVAGIGLMSELTGNNSGGEEAASYSILTYPPGVNPNDVGPCIDTYIRSAIPSSPLIGRGLMFAQAGKQYNVNPGLMIAVGKQESSLGTAGIVLSHPYNYYGLTKSGGGWAEFNSWDEAINNQARYLRESYFDVGLGTIAQIGGKYAPVGANNDPNNLNNNWVKGVSESFDAIISHCPSLKVSPVFAGAGDIVTIAHNELGKREAFDNCDCGVVLKYGGNSGDAWCAFFVTWVYRQAGHSVPSMGGAKAVYDWFDKNQTAFLKGQGTPQPGDIVYFHHSHVGIVESLGSNGTLYTIEGNAGQHPQRVKREIYPNYVNNGDIHGFGRWKK